MTDYYIFGTYYSKNSNLDSNFTADRANAKWRSQITLLNSSPDAVADNGDHYLLDNLVYIVAISDLDYQLRKTAPVGDRFRIRRKDGGNRNDSVYLGSSAVRTFAHVDLDFVATANPNPNPFPKPAPFPKPLVGLEYNRFAEARLELGYDYGAVGGQSFETAITEVADDREQRNINRYLPLGRWQLGDRLYADSQADKLEEVKYLREFHNGRKGSFEGFRFKDWADYKGVGQVIAVGDGVRTDFQLRKAYRAGNAVTYRPIQKPVIGTVDILLNGVNVIYTPNHGWEVDHATGVVRNNTPLTNGATLSCNFEFDVPVWFEADEIGFKLEGYDPEVEASIYRLESVFVVEGRIPLTLPWTIPALPEITEELDLGIVYDTIEKYAHSTNKLELGSGYTRRQAKREDSRILFDLGGRNYDRAEVDKILGYFYCARGKAAEFAFTNLGKNYKVRFDSDNLNLKFEAANTDDALFNLSGLKIQVDEEVIKQEVIDYSLLYGHFTFLETARNGDLFNYHVYGQNKLTFSFQVSIKSNTVQKNNRSVYSLSRSSGTESNNDAIAISSTVDVPLNSFPGLTLIADFKRTNFTTGGQSLFGFIGKISLLLIPNGNWQAVAFGQLKTITNFSGHFTPDVWHSVTVSLDFSSAQFTVYVDSLVEFTTTFAPFTVTVGKAFFTVRGANSLESTALQIWKKALTQAEITRLHPGGKRIAFRSSTVADSILSSDVLVGLFPYLSFAGAYLFNNSAVTPFTIANISNIAAVKDSAFIFAGSDYINIDEHSKLEEFTSFKQNYFIIVAYDTQPTTEQFWVEYRRGSSGSKLQIGIDGSRIFIRNTGNAGTSLTFTNFYCSVPLSFFDGSPQEIQIKIFENKIILNGVTIAVGFASIISYSLMVGGTTLGAKLAQDGIGFTGFVTGKIYLITGFDDNYFANFLNSNSYTTQNTNEFKAARLFYQMGFKRSLTVLESNNPRLLAGDYPI